MAFQYNGACYETPESFLQAVAANSQGVTLHDGIPIAYSSTVSGTTIITTTSQGAQGEIVNILLKIKNSFLPTKQILIDL